MSGADAEALKDTGDRIEQLLVDLRSMVGPPAMRSVEELVGRLVDLYGAGLERIVAKLGKEDVARLLDDGLVHSLLVLHDLHPLDVRARVERALDSARPYLGSHAGGVTLLGAEAGVVRIRLEGSCDGCSSSAATVKLTLERAILESVPDVTRVEVEGAVDTVPAPEASLIQLRRPTSAPSVP
jgi:Fe-S cluster biogenesis protein NfuA